MNLRAPRIETSMFSAKRHEIMLFTREAKCERDHREAAILFRFLSPDLSLHARAIFMGK